MRFWGEVRSSDLIIWYHSQPLHGDVPSSFDRMLTEADGVLRRVGMMCPTSVAKKNLDWFIRLVQTFPFECAFGVKLGALILSRSHFDVKKLENTNNSNSTDVVQK